MEQTGIEQSSPDQPGKHEQVSVRVHTPPFSHILEQTAVSARILLLRVSAMYKNSDADGTALAYISMPFGPLKRADNGGLPSKNPQLSPKRAAGRPAIL